MTSADLECEGDAISATVLLSLLKACCADKDKIRSGVSVRFANRCSYHKHAEGAVLCGMEELVRILMEETALTLKEPKV